MSSVQGQMIGAAARDPKVQAAAVSAAQNPHLQSAAWKVAQDAARQNMAEQKGDSRGGFLASETSSTKRVNCSIRLWCIATALALVVFSILGMVNVFNAAFHPFQYLMAVYNLFFALVIIVTEGEEAWFKRIGNLQGRLFAAAPCLSWRAGRSLLYFYVGSINLFLLPESWIWKVIYICIGGCLCGAGLLMFVDRCMDNCRGRQQERPPHINV